MTLVEKSSWQPIHVAVIDDGINEKLYNTLYLENNIEITSELSISKRINYNSASISHGTMCAAIIQKYSSCKNLSSVKILNEKAKGSKKQLIKAIEWCIKKNINLINLSLGSIDYRDCLDIKNIVNLAYKKGIIIVAACSNKGIFTYPASLSNLIGVKCDKRNILKFNEYNYNAYAMDGIEITANSQHELIDFMGDKINTCISNSFAAPVITALVYKIMTEFPSITLEDIKEKLRINSSNLIKGRYYPNFYKNIDWIQKGIMFVMDKENNIYDINRYGIDLYDIIHIDCHNLSDGLYRIIEYIEVNKNIFNDIDTIIIAHENKKCYLDDKEVSYIKKIDRYSKNIVYIDDNYNCFNPTLLNQNLKRKIWHPFVYNYYNCVVGNENKIEVPIVIVYDFIGRELNNLVYDLCEKFKADGYSVVSASNKCSGILSGCEFIPLCENTKGLGDIDLSPLSKLYAVYDPDIIIYGIDAVQKDNAELLSFMRNSQIDINIFFTQEYACCVDYINKVHNINNKFVIISKEDKINEPNEKTKVFSYLEKELISEIYKYLILMLKS